MSYLVHVKFDFNGVHGDWEKDLDHTFPFDRAVAAMNALPNLKWKIWGSNEDHTELCGFYLYPTKEAAIARAEQAKATLHLYDGISNVRPEIWEILDDYSVATHAPVDVPMISEL